MVSEIYLPLEELFVTVAILSWKIVLIIKSGIIFFSISEAL
jgi:hypothetical protein